MNNQMQKLEFDVGLRLGYLRCYHKMLTQWIGDIHKYMVTIMKWLFQWESQTYKQ